MMENLVCENYSQQLHSMQAQTRAGKRNGSSQNGEETTEENRDRNSVAPSDWDHPRVIGWIFPPEWSEREMRSSQQGGQGAGEGWKCGPCPEILCELWHVSAHSPKFMVSSGQSPLCVLKQTESSMSAMGICPVCVCEAPMDQP